MTFRGISEHKHFRPAVGATVAVFCGLALWSLSPGDKWIEASYDNLFRFGSRTVTNQVVIVFMDKEAFGELKQTREEPWDRSLHARFLNKLADDDCPLVVLDAHFARPGNAAADKALQDALARLTNVVLAAGQAKAEYPGLESVRWTIPPTNFLHAARTNWGIAWLASDLDRIVRRHWPFPSPADYAPELPGLPGKLWVPSLPWTAALCAGAHLSERPTERWIRYYDFNRAWTSLSYHLALAKAAGYFRGKTVFIGTKPLTPEPGDEPDEFRTPHIEWTGETVGGVEVLATCFLNLVNGDWLRRAAWPVEGFLFMVTGTLFGAGLCRFRRCLALTWAVVAAFTITIGAVCLSYFSNYWFPWLILVGGQLPCALAWALVPAKAPPVRAIIAKQAGPQGTVVLDLPEEPLPEAPEYELITPAIGRGGFGKVWIVRNAIGQWQALKAVYQSKFGDNRGPYEAEFKGLRRYKPVSEKHPGLLRIDLVSKMKAKGYFYYVMELGDALSPGWEKQPHLYKPRDLENLRRQTYGRRLPPAECLRIVTVLADALNFLHQQGLTHRDIKPSNVIFVNGRPKLADVGLVADIRPVDQVQTLVGTLGYMPPPPEKPGTVQADIYALGMLLYVISTGRDPDSFPELSTTLMERTGHAEFIRLNAIIIRACQPDISQRYQNMADMLRDLEAGSMPAPQESQ